jgi:hypothetical protein
MTASAVQRSSTPPRPAPVLPRAYTTRIRPARPRLKSEARRHSTRAAQAPFTVNFTRPPPTPPSPTQTHLTYKPTRPFRPCWFARGPSGPPMDGIKSTRPGQCLRQPTGPPTRSVQPLRTAAPLRVLRFHYLTRTEQYAPVTPPVQTSYGPAPTRLGPYHPAPVRPCAYSTRIGPPSSCTAQRLHDSDLTIRLTARPRAYVTRIRPDRLRLNPKPGATIHGLLRHQPTRPIVK